MPAAGPLVSAATISLDLSSDQVYSEVQGHYNPKPKTQHRKSCLFRASRGVYRVWDASSLHGPIPIFKRD